MLKTPVFNRPTLAQSIMVKPFRHYRYSSIQLKIQENTYTIVFYNTGQVLTVL